jgi:DNA-binding transcriptional MerR regulator
MSAVTGYRIAEVARRTGFTTPTLRYYEEIGLMPPAQRTEAGYRVYDERAVQRLLFIARAKQLGCRLEEIAELVRAWDTEDCGPVQHRLRSRVMAKVSEVQQQMAETMAFLADLQATAAALNGLPAEGSCDADCGCSTAPTAASPSATSPVTSVSRRGTADAPPLACSLGAGDMQARLADWQAVLALVEARLPIPGGLRLEFRSAAPLVDIARLAAAEYECCPFFGFAVTIDGRGLALEVTAPVDGQEVLVGVFGAPR